MKLEDKILQNLNSLVAQYEADLGFLHNRSMHKFDTTVLPQIVQDLIKLATAKSPSFRNVSATAVAKLFNLDCQFIDTKQLKAHRVSLQKKNLCTPIKVDGRNYLQINKDK